MRSSRTRARTCVPCIGRRFLTTAPPGKPPKPGSIKKKEYLSIGQAHNSLCITNFLISPTMMYLKHRPNQVTPQLQLLSPHHPLASPAPQPGTQDPSKLVSTALSCPISPLCFPAALSSRQALLNRPDFSHLGAFELAVLVAGIVLPESCLFLLPSLQLSHEMPAIQLSELLSSIPPSLRQFLTMLIWTFKPFSSLWKQPLNFL